MASFLGDGTHKLTVSRFLPVSLIAVEKAQHSKWRPTLSLRCLHTWYRDSTSLLLVREEKNIKLLTRWAPHNVMIWGSTTIILSTKLFLPTDCHCHMYYLLVFSWKKQSLLWHVFTKYENGITFSFAFLVLCKNSRFSSSFSNRRASCACKMSHFSKNKLVMGLKTILGKNVFP